MALVKYGGGIVQMSGSIAGSVFARNRFGNYVRPRTKPVNPHSARQEHARAIVSELAAVWHQALSSANRGQWENYAAAVAMKNRLGETIHLTGFNHFIRTNGARMTMGLGYQTGGPSIQSLPDKDSTLQCTEESIANQEFTFACNPANWAANGDPKLYILVYQGRPQLKTRNQFATPWRFMDQINAEAGVQGVATLKGAFTFTAGQKVWFQARVLTVQGRLTQLWNLNPRDIQADA